MTNSATVPLEAKDTNTAATGQKPNVVFILGDNIGYGDMGPYGGGELRGYPTPEPTRWPARVCA